MKKFLGIYSTNQINKYDYRFSVETLEVCLSQTWRYGTPMFISHDYHRPLGWSSPLGLQILPTQVGLLGISLWPENDEEQKVINNKSQAYLTTKLSNINDNDKQELENKLRQYLSGNETYLIRECVSVIDEDIARKALPNLFKGAENDKRCLVPLKNLNQIAPGVYEVEGFAVFAHRYYRRSLSQINNLNDIFLSKLYELANIEGLDVKIALDPHSLGIINSYHSPIELEYWWGPKFDDSLLDIPSGITRHESSERQRYFHGISRTEFWWHKQDGIQSLECEEIRDIPSLGISHDDYGCRYVHSMINKDNGKPYHLDGAIRIYNEEKFIDRLDIDISRAGKDTQYIKLWRIDGEIDVSTWKYMICHFYRDNHLPGEYLSGKDEKAKETEITSTITKESQFSHVPYDFKPNDGVEIFVSYQTKEAFSDTKSVSVVSYYSIVSDENKTRVIELTSLNFIKILRLHMNEPVHMDEGIKFVDYFDMDINFPTVILRGENAVENANKALKCLSTFLEKLEKPDENRIVTANFVIEYDDKFVQFSFVSHIASLNSYLKKGNTVFPNQFRDIGKWTSEQHDNLNSYFNMSSLILGDKNLLKTYGIHRINRDYVDQDMMSFNKSTNEFSLRIHQSNHDLLKAISDSKITCTPVVIVNGTECLSCKRDYLECDCSPVESNSTAFKVVDAKQIGFCWVRERA